MRLHTNNPGAVEAAIRAAVASLPGVDVVNLSSHGSRSRACGLELALSGTGRSGGQWGGGGYKSATWDEWGVVLWAAFAADARRVKERRPSLGNDGMKAGPYLDAEHFNWSTNTRYREGVPCDAHIRHCWEYQGEGSGGAYQVRKCKGCTAIRRAMSHGRHFDEIR